MPTPALFTSTSIREKRSTVRSTSARQDASLVTSVGTTSVSAPRAVPAAATAASAASSRAARTSRGRWAASSRTSARPIPCDAPVTTTTLPSYGAAI